MLSKKRGKKKQKMFRTCTRCTECTYGHDHVGDVRIDHVDNNLYSRTANARSQQNTGLLEMYCCIHLFVELKSERRQNTLSTISTQKPWLHMQFSKLELPPFSCCLLNNFGKRWEQDLVFVQIAHRGSARTHRSTHWRAHSACFHPHARDEVYFRPRPF